jgi:hypothetical protein
VADSSGMRTIQTSTPAPGDRILIALGNDRCHIEKITPAGDQVLVRDNVRSDLAWQIAIAGAEENHGVVWECQASARTTFRRVSMSDR